MTHVSDEHESSDEHVRGSDEHVSGEHVSDQHASDEQSSDEPRDFVIVGKT